MDDHRSLVTIATATKKTMSRSFLIDSLIGNVRHSPAVNAAAVPYHPQLSEYLQFLNRIPIAAAAAYGYQSPAPTVFPSAVGPRLFGYPATGTAVGTFSKDYCGYREQKHQPQSPAIVKPTAVIATSAGQRNKHNNNYYHQAKTTSSKKRTADDAKTVTYDDPGKWSS